MPEGPRSGVYGVAHVTWRDTTSAVRNEVARLGGDAYFAAFLDREGGWLRAEEYACSPPV